MTGTHAFTLHFFVPCGDQSGIPCGSSPSYMLVEAGTWTATMTFV